MVSDDRDVDRDLPADLNEGTLQKGDALNKLIVCAMH